MEEKGSSEEMGSGGGLSSGLESFPSHQLLVDNSNAMALRQWMYQPYVPQIDFTSATNFMAGSSSSASARLYHQASPPPLRDELKKTGSSVAQPWNVKSGLLSSGWYGTPAEVRNPNVWYRMPQLEEELEQTVGSESSRSLIQDGISTTDGSGSKNAGVVLDSASTKQNKGKRLGSNYENDRRRRKVIGERLKALEELVPQSAPGQPGDLLEDTIDYIKFLQLQLKDLSQSRLGGETVSDPLVFIEGYGHYFVHEPMVNEPLDEMMGRLLEVSPQEAAAILESKGLFIRDISLAKGL